MEKLKQFREDLGKTQEEMAKSLNISKSFYIKIENRTKSPGREVIKKIKEIYPYFDIAIFLL